MRLFPIFLYLLLILYSRLPLLPQRPPAPLSKSSLTVFFSHSSSTGPSSFSSHASSSRKLSQIFPIPNLNQPLPARVSKPLITLLEHLSHKLLLLITSNVCVLYWTIYLPQIISSFRTLDLDRLPPIYQAASKFLMT